MNKIEEDIKMAESSRNPLFHAFNFRESQQTPKNQRDFEKKIKKMVKKQMKRQIPALREELLHILQTNQLRFFGTLHKLFESCEEVARSRQSTSSDPNWQQKNMDGVGSDKNITSQDHKLSLLSLSASSEIYSDLQLLPTWQIRSSLANQDKEIRPFCSDFRDFFTSESLQTFMFKKGWKEKRVNEDKTMTDKILLMDEEWNEWSDEEELVEERTYEEGPCDEQNTEKGEGAGLHASEEPKSQRRETRSAKGEIATWVQGLFDHCTAYKWKRFENES